MFLAIAVDNLADAQSLTEIEEEKAEERERTKSIRRSKSKSPEKDQNVRFLARLHEVHRAIVVTSVVRIYVYVYVRVTLSVKVF